MNNFLKIAKEIADGNKDMSKHEFDLLITNMDKLSDDEKKEMANLLLTEATFNPILLDKYSLLVLKDILPLKDIVNYLISIISLSQTYEKESPIFEDKSLITYIAEVLQKVKHRELWVLRVLYNNGFGDKKEVGRYIKSANAHIFNYSTKWEREFKKFKIFAGLNAQKLNRYYN